VVTKHSWTSTIFPGTVRDYWVYVPAQYRADRPACVMVFQDGGGFLDERGRWRIPIVFDNLIHQGAMPATIGIFINPGFLPLPGPGRPGRPNRSFEYDAVSDRYVRFLLEEILPQVGKHYSLSKDPNDRAICGSSSGGICAFTAAWFRPDAFRRVLTFVGSFTNLRGGDVYPSLIRKSETKPLRVFLQSGKRDMNTYAGSWYIANQAMADSFEYMGYDYKVVLGEGGHDALQGSAILPDALRWLWRGYPQPIAAPHPAATRQWATNIVVPDRGWEPVGKEIRTALDLAADRQGTVCVVDAAGNRIVKLDEHGRAVPFKNFADGKRIVKLDNLTDGPPGLTRGPDRQWYSCAPSKLTFGPDGRLYTWHTRADLNDGTKSYITIPPDGRIVRYAADGAESVLATWVQQPFDMVVDRQGGVYYSEPHGHGVYYIDDAGGKKRVVDGKMWSPAGLRLLASGSLLVVADSSERWAWSFQVRQDGSLANGEAFYRLETADKSSESGAAGVAVDTEGFVYIATELGIQVGDREGRTAFIITNPPGGRVTSLAFGGPDFQTLYAIAGGILFRRPVQRKGI
jgi:enterochelin esterase-like enzyme/sugar lactone lactonase YvrE